MDQLSLKRIELLHPAIRQKAKDTFSDMESALTGRAKPRLTYTLRTLKEQQELYNLGRTKVNPDGKSPKKPMGNIVTNAKAGQSIHNYGLAFDFALIIDGKEASWNTIKDWDGDFISDWMECVNVAKSHGWEWGGDWKTFKDEPHLQYDFGYTWQQLQVKMNLGKFYAGTTYVDIVRGPVIGNTSYRTTASVNLRSGAGTNFSVKVTVLKGEYVQELSRSGIWSKVVYNGLEGFMSNQYLTK